MDKVTQSKRFRRCYPKLSADHSCVIDKPRLQGGLTKTGSGMVGVSVTVLWLKFFRQFDQAHGTALVLDLIGASR